MTPQLELGFRNGAVLLPASCSTPCSAGPISAAASGTCWRAGPRADQQRQVIARAIGPIWEANHVWLIFVDRHSSFTVFPPVFAALSIALYIPLSLALLGIVLRGAAFVFRAYAHDVTLAQQGWGGVFAIASTVTPGLLRNVRRSGRQRRDPRRRRQFEGSDWRTWLSPFPIVIGLLSLTTCAYLAAVYLTIEAQARESWRRISAAARSAPGQSSPSYP